MVKLNKLFRTNLLLLFILSLTVVQAQEGKGEIAGGIIFVVDEGLESLDDPYEYIFGGRHMAKDVLLEYGVDKPRIIATSFDKDSNLVTMDKFPFYDTVLHAYAYHQSLPFSPDMIWLLICQGFSRYVNAHTEEMRSVLVPFEGKRDLVVKTNKNLTDNTDTWPRAIKDHVSLINKSTKGELVNILTAPFSTTGDVETVVSGITLMETVKPYFSYKVHNSLCGIPRIRLTGTGSDWENLVERTQKLKQYGMREWLESLEPILNEFAKAANGNPNQVFWQSMVRTKPLDKIVRRDCTPKEPTKFDGWILNFFPNEDGVTPKTTTADSTFPSELSSVSLKYQIVSESTKHVIDSYNIELWAGFIGAEKDEINHFITPKIGWIIRYSIKKEDY